MNKQKIISKVVEIISEMTDIHFASIEIVEEIHKEYEKQCISVDYRLPDEETPVMVTFIDCSIRILELRWEYTGYEDTFNRFQYWDDPYNDGQCIDWHNVTHWMPLSNHLKKVSNR